MKYNIKKIINNNLKLNVLNIYYFSDANREDFLKSSFLSNLIVTSTKNYKKRLDFNRKLEELYGLYVDCDTIRFGKTQIFSLSFSFLSPRFVNDDDYPNEIMSFLNEILFNPNISDGEFDKISFNKIKQDFLSEQCTISENASQLSFVRAMDGLQGGETSKIFLDDYTEKEIKKVKNKDIVNYYNKLIKSENNMAILFSDEKSINKFVGLDKIISNKKILFDLYDEEYKSSKIIKSCDKSHFNQSNLVLIYKLNNLDEREKLYTIQLFNYIFANGSFKAKLFKKLREEHSFCYGVSGNYIKYDNLYMIRTHLIYDNLNEALELINESLNEMINGDFSDEILSEAKLSIVDKLNSSKNYAGGYIKQGLFEVVDNYPSLDKRIIEYQKITREEIMNISKKIILVLQYVLKEDETNEKD